MKILQLQKATYSPVDQIVLSDHSRAIETSDRQPMWPPQVSERAADLVYKKAKIPYQQPQLISITR